MPTPLPTFPTSTLSVRPWPDVVIDEVGHDPRSPYVEQFWLGVLGPTATWLLRRLVARLEASPAGFDLDLALTAHELGLAGRSGQHSPFVRAIARCCRFGAAELVDAQTLRVRRKLPPLTRLQVGRLPEPLQVAHRRWIEDQAPGTGVAVTQLRNRARHLALSLLELGEDGESTERQLHRWRIHPAMAHDATAWAVARHRAARHAVAAEEEATAAAVEGVPRSDVDLHAMECRSTSAAGHPGPQPALANDRPSDALRSAQRSDAAPTMPVGDPPEAA